MDLNYCRKITTICCLIFFLVGCGKQIKQEEHLIQNVAYRTIVKKTFEKRKAEFAKQDTLLFFLYNNEQLTLQQKEGLEFLYAYMPLNDLADYTGNYFLTQVNYALKAKNTFSWGKNLSDELFLHFVLPYRVNNENLDSCRSVFFNELKDRVLNLPDTVAALEVNHWCHEKVSYRGADIRTSSPLATVKTSWGRCGEESTLLVAALRSVGLPARQVYTPRWAHQDDNHAWVEVYAGGRWRYLGACEPEPRLNVGWFDVPAKRAMLIHTKAFGFYQGTEEVIRCDSMFSELNVLPAYTETKLITVKVIDDNKQPVKNAIVQYQLYNYAEFYPLATMKTDENGKVKLRVGLGHLCFWVNKGEQYSYAVGSTNELTDITLVLRTKKGKEYTERFEWNVPKEQQVPLLSSELLNANRLRLLHEDSIRNAYKETFMQTKAASALAQKLSLNEAKVVRFIKKSYGNHAVIASYLTKFSKCPLVLDLLEVISAKDLRDVDVKTLEHHLVFTSAVMTYPSTIMKKSILNPRIRNEKLVPWRRCFQQYFPYSFKKKVRKDISILVDWVNKNIKIDGETNYYNCPITPLGVHFLKRADKISRNIYFVAICRSLEIPARINSATDNVQLYKDEKWVNVYFEKQQNIKKGHLTLHNDVKNGLEPSYYTHYTIQRFDNGNFHSLDYYGDPAVQHFPVELELEPGYYLLMTGHRYTDGNVRILTQYFNVKSDETVSKTVTLLPLKQRKQILGKIDLNLSVKQFDGQKALLSDYVSDKGLMLLLVDPANEPTRHIMKDMPVVGKRLEKWGGKILFVVPDDKITKAFNPNSYSTLPTNASFAVDVNRRLLKRILKSCGKSDEILPTVLYLTPQGEIIFLTQGYRIGVGNDLLETTVFDKKDKK